MANIFDYMKWRDIELEKLEFNEIDNLILARVSYFPFDGLIKEDECLTIKEIYSRYLKSNNKEKILWDDDEELFKVLSNSVRFGNMKIFGYVNKVDIKEEIQFSAVTLLTDDNVMYISYRGTDNTIVGWKEDANMSFSELVPSQVDALEYLEKISKMRSENIRIGGHSKGGNLAVYASAFCDKEIKDRIIKVYNNDGPGFSSKIIEKPEYKEVIKKVERFIPQSSVIGRFLNTKEKTKVIKSTQKGLMQHDLYSWQVMANKFEEAELTNSSEFIDKTITDWLENVSAKQREDFFDCLFEIFYATKAEQFKEIPGKLYSNSKIMIKTYQNLPEESREVINKTLKELFIIGKNNVELPKINIRLKKKIKGIEDTNNQ